MGTGRASWRVGEGEEAVADQGLSAATRQKLDSYASLLEARSVRCVRLVPLVLREPVETLFRRRAGLFARFGEGGRQEWGIEMAFERRLRPTREHRDGRIVRGGFDVIHLSSGSCLLGWTGDRDGFDHGALRLARGAYPLATRPFITSGPMLRLLEAMADAHGWAATAADTMGYSRQTHSFGKDMEPLPLRQAFDEFARDRRLVHSVVVKCKDARGHQKLRAQFDRHGQVLVLDGSATEAAEGFALPAIAAFLANSQTFEVPREPDFRTQRAVHLDFPAHTFPTPREMEKLADAIRQGEGLGVSIVHLNPYMEAQVLDYFSGATVDVVVMQGHRVSLVPRTEGAHDALERIASTVFRFFGEAELRVGTLTGS